MNDNEYYKTVDIFLAATLSLFYPIESIDKTSPQKVSFGFRKAKYLDTVIDSYWKKELKVEPQTLLYQLKAIKSRLYEQR